MTTATTTMTTIRDTTVTSNINHLPEEAMLVAEAAAAEAAAAEEEEQVVVVVVEAELAMLAETTSMPTKSEWWPVNRARMSSSWASTMTSQKPTSVLTCSSLRTRILNLVCSPGSFPLFTVAGVFDQSRLSARDCHYHPREINRHLPITCSCCWPFALTTRSFLLSLLALGDSVLLAIVAFSALCRRIQGLWFRPVRVSGARASICGPLVSIHPGTSASLTRRFCNPGILQSPRDRRAT